MANNVDQLSETIKKGPRPAKTVFGAKPFESATAISGAKPFENATARPGASTVPGISTVPGAAPAPGAKPVPGNSPVGGEIAPLEAAARQFMAPVPTSEVSRKGFTSPTPGGKSPAEETAGGSWGSPAEETAGGSWAGGPAAQSPALSPLEQGLMNQQQGILKQIQANQPGRSDNFYLMDDPNARMWKMIESGVPMNQAALAAHGQPHGASTPPATHPPQASSLSEALGSLGRQQQALTEARGHQQTIEAMDRRQAREIEANKPLREAQREETLAGAGQRTAMAGIKDLEEAKTKEGPAITTSLDMRKQGKPVEAFNILSGTSKLTDLKRSQLEGFAPEEIRAVYDAAKGQPNFKQVMARINEIWPGWQEPVAQPGWFH